MPKNGNKDWFTRGIRFLSACANGCYKHYVKGLGWVCCKCGA